MFSLLSKCSKFDIPTDIRLELFDQLVKAVMLYACEVWGYERTDIIERLHLKFLKYILKVKMSNCNNMIYGELGRCPICIDIKKTITGYWECLVMGKETKFSATMCNCLYNLYTNGIYVSP